ncbi:hypothetical protein TSTA_126980, partial [Talaromyces stipitatus ATCC 10500]
MTLLDSGATVHITNKWDKLINMQLNVQIIMARKIEIQILWSEQTNKDLCHVKCTGKLYLLEWNSNKNSKTSLSKELALSSFDKRILKDPTQATKEANITALFQKRNKEGFKEKCEVYAIIKIRKKISRVLMTPPTRLFQKLFVDIIVMNLAINKNSYALHAVNPYTKFHILMTTRTKSVNFNLENMIEEIKHTFKTRIEEIQLDGESSLNGISFRDYSQKRKIRLIVTVLDTLEQNGPSERAGGIISMKS